MAGAHLTLIVDDADAQVLFGRLAEFSGAPMQLALADIGEHLLNSTRDRAAAQVDPSGVPWVPLSPRYERFKEKKRPNVPKLKFDAHMLGDQLSYQARPGSLDLGTSAVYGAIQQFGGKPGMRPGTRNIPARIWLGLSEQDRTDIVEILGEHLQRAIGGA